MFKGIFLLSLAALFSLSPLAMAQSPLSCDIRADFGSFTATIDAPAYEKILAQALATPSITEKHIENIGPNGERTLCLMTQDEADIQPVYDDLKKLVPLKSKTGWVRLSTRLGDQVMTRKISSWTREGLDIPATDSTSSNGNSL